MLAGRSQSRAGANWPSALGGLEYVRADVMRQNSVFDLVGADDVLVSTVGPFVKWGEPAVRAAVAAGCTYLDSTGEPPFIRRVFEEFGPPAARSGARLLTAMGYDFAPGALAGALALEDAGPDAVRVDVGYYALGGGPTSLSAGTRESLVGVTLGDGHAYRDGRVRSVRPAERVRSFTRRGQAARGDLGRRRRALRAARVLSRAARGQRLPGLVRAARAAAAGGLVRRRVRAQASRWRTTAMRFAGERVLGAGRPGPRRGRRRAGARGSPPRPTTRAGRQLSEVHLAGVDGYEFTAALPGLGRAAAGRRRRRARAGRGLRARAPGGGRRGSRASSASSRAEASRA